jgi:hypothetical protein
MRAHWCCGFHNMRGFGMSATRNLSHSVFYLSHIIQIKAGFVWSSEYINAVDTDLDTLYCETQVGRGHGVPMHKRPSNRNTAKQEYNGKDSLVRFQVRYNTYTRFSSYSRSIRHSRWIRVIVATDFLARSKATGSYSKHGKWPWPSSTISQATRQNVQHGDGIMKLYCMNIQLNRSYPSYVF